MQQRCRIELLGGLRVLQGDRIITRFNTQKTASLLAYLAYHEDRPHAREQLAEMFWPESEPRAGRSSLNMAVSSLRRQLEPPGAPFGSVLLSDRFTLQLNPLGVTTDVGEWRSLLQAAERAESDSQRIDLLCQAMELYRGEPAPGYYDEWVVAEQRLCADRFIQTLRHLAALLQRVGAFDRAVDYARRAVAADPLSEEPHRELMTVYAAAGQPAAALRQFAELERLLQDELDEQPSASLRALAERIRAQKLLGKLFTEAARSTPVKPPGATNGPTASRTVEADSADRPEAPPRKVPSDAAEGSSLPACDVESAAKWPTAPAPDVEAPADGPTASQDEPADAADGRDRKTLPAPTALLRRSSPTSASVAPAVSPGPILSLPLQFTRFFGREEELSRLRSLLQPTGPAPCRLVTLSGPGGAGKTRLAIETARYVAEMFTGGVWFASLADLMDARLIPDAILRTLDRPRSPQLDPLEQILAFLNDAQTPPTPKLLILDNFEHLTEAGAGIALALLSRVPALTCLVTSRRRLGLPGERVFAVPPLPSPGELQAGGPEPGRSEVAFAFPSTTGAGLTGASFQSANPEALLAFPSVALFVDRAQAVRSDFQVTERNAATVAALCRQLEGLPLAIELAAARSQTLTPTQILTRLKERFELPANRRAASRHRSLWAAIAWSYDLLSPAQQRFFALLSVFRGGFDLEAAQEVCAAGEGIDAESTPILESLAQLRERSLLTVEEAGQAMRYRLIEPLRQFAEERLTAAERVQIHRRHSRYFHALVDQAEPHLVGATEPEWLDRLERDRDNLRAVLERYLAAPADPAEDALRFVASFWMFWNLRGYFTEGRRALAAALEQFPQGSPLQRGKALTGAGVLAYRQSDYAQARRLLTESRLRREEAGDRRGGAVALYNLGNVCRVQADFAAARDCLETCLQTFRELEDRAGVAAARAALGNMAQDQGDYATAQALQEESLAEERAAGDMAGVAAALVNLGLLALTLEEYDQAQALLEEGLALRRELGDQAGTAYAVTGLAAVAIGQGRWAPAAALLAEGLRTFQEVGQPRGIAMALEIAARYARGQGRRARAVQLYSAAQTLRLTVGAAPDPAQFAEVLADARAALTEREMETALAAGRKMTPTQAIAFALNDIASG